MLPFATWAAGLDARVTAATGISGSSEVLPTNVKDILNVRGFEPLARAALPPAHFGYLATGIDDDRTLRRNEDAFSDYEMRARRCGVPRVSISVTVLPAMSEIATTCGSEPHFLRESTCHR